LEISSEKEYWWLNFKNYIFLNDSFYFNTTLLLGAHDHIKKSKYLQMYRTIFHCQLRGKKAIFLVFMCLSPMSHTYPRVLSSCSNVDHHCDIYY
jgi:hypothetical protein